MTSIIETLDTLAEFNIPDGTHQYLHIDNKKMWVKIVSQLIENGDISYNKQTLKYLLTNWESLLYITYSKLN